MVCKKLHCAKALRHQAGRGVIWVMVGINVIAVLVTMLSKMGSSGNLQLVSDAIAEVPPVVKQAEFFLHCGAFEDEKQARARADVLSGMGLVSKVELHKNRLGPDSYAVIAGPVVSRDSVLDMRERLYRAGIDTIKLQQLADGTYAAGG